MHSDQNSNKPAQSTPSQDKPIPMDTQAYEDPIASAQRRTYAAREQLQSAYIIFQENRSLSEFQVSDYIYSSKSLIEGISDLFVDLTISSSLELAYKLACEERYICERMTIVIAYFLRNDLHSLSIFQVLDKEFQKIFSGLANLENLIAQLQKLAAQSDYVHKHSL